MIKRLVSELPKKIYRKVFPIKYDDLLSTLKIKARDTTIDCGANIGYYTNRMASKGATVYAFEPNPWAFEILNSNFLKNPKVHCINKGVLDKDGTFKLYLHQNAEEDQVKWSNGCSLLSYKKNVDEKKFVEIKVIDLNKFIENLNKKVKVLKINIEGVECRILNKLMDSGIIHKIKYVLVELHDHKIPELKEETDLLRERILKEKLTNFVLNWKSGYRKDEARN